MRKTYDCAPTLDDEGVLAFCKKGFLTLEGVVDDEVNRRTSEFIEEHDGMKPTEILSEEWFVDAVIKNPQAAGAIRSAARQGIRSAHPDVPTTAFARPSRRKSGTRTAAPNSGLSLTSSRSSTCRRTARASWAQRSWCPGPTSSSAIATPSRT